MLHSSSLLCVCSTVSLMYSRYKCIEDEINVRLILNKSCGS